MYKRSPKLYRTMHQRNLRCKRGNDELLNLDLLLSEWGTPLGSEYWNDKISDPHFGSSGIFRF